MVMKNTGIPRFMFILFKERDGLNSYFRIQIVERDVLLKMCHGILFFKTKSVMEFYTFLWNH